MAEPVIMPKLGNTVESCIILRWYKAVGDNVELGDPLCEVETDKAVMEVESPVSGVLLGTYFQPGDEVPVQTNIAVIGQPGEDVSRYGPQAADTAGIAGLPSASEGETRTSVGAAPAPVEHSQAKTPEIRSDANQFASPRARNLALRESVDLTGLEGTGPGGRIIERDVQKAMAMRKPISPLARAMLDKGEFTAPVRGSGSGGRIMTRDLVPAASDGAPADVDLSVADVIEIPIEGVRKRIAERMLHSMQTSAQLTLNASADARALLAYRKRLKGSAEALGLQQVTINDLILFVVARMLLQHSELNALFDGETIYQHKQVQLGFAVDTPRGLIVPVLRDAHALSLKQLSLETRRLADACINGEISPDELTGGTFTVTNLGSLGIESFTPILNPPQVGILGVGNVNLKPIEDDGEVRFIQHIGLSLTINHQVVDGAPAARFLQELCQGIAEVDVFMAL